MINMDLVVEENLVSEEETSWDKAVSTESDSDCFIHYMVLFIVFVFSNILG